MVLDPFTGSGSPLVAAHRPSRDYLGTELVAYYGQPWTKAI